MKQARALNAKVLSPARLVVTGFFVATVLGALLLSLPFAYAGKQPSFVEVIFTSVSALCLAGLTVVDTPTFWSPTGHLVLLLLMQVGAFGIMTLGSLLGMMVSQKLSLRTRLNSTAESKALGLNNFRKLLLRVFEITLVIELVTAVLLAWRFNTSYGFAIHDAIWYGVFHSVSSFSNGGFALFSDSLGQFVADPFMLLVCGFSMALGGLGFPVLVETYRRMLAKARGRSYLELGLPSQFSLHARLVFIATGALYVFGAIAFSLIEWTNPATLGPLGEINKFVNAIFLSLETRSGGLSAVNIGELRPESLLIADLLMFIGASSAGTSGGIKVTTLAVIIFIVIAEIRGASAVNVGGRRLPRSIQRQALTIAFLATALVIASIVCVQLISGFSTDQVAFEVISAFGTVGLSTGITAALPESAQLLLVFLMFVGRVGLVLFASALATNAKVANVKYPVERPIIG